MVIEPDIHHAAAHRDDRAEIRVAGVLVHVFFRFSVALDHVVGLSERFSNLSFRGSIPQ